MQPSVYSRNITFIESFHSHYVFEEVVKSERFGQLLVYRSQDQSKKLEYVAVRSYETEELLAFNSGNGMDQLNDFLKTAAKVYDNKMNNHTNIVKIIAYQCDIPENPLKDPLSSAPFKKAKVKIYLEHHRSNMASLLSSNPFSFSEYDCWELLYEITSVMTFLEGQNRWVGEIQLEFIQMPTQQPSPLLVAPFKMTPIDQIANQYVKVISSNQTEVPQCILSTDIKKYFKSDVLMTGISLMRLLLNNNSLANELAKRATQQMQVSEQQINTVLIMCQSICSASLFSLISSMVCAKEQVRPKGSDIFKFLLNNISQIRSGKSNELLQLFIEPAVNSTYDFKRSPSSNQAQFNFSSMINQCPSLILLDEDQPNTNRENIKMQRILDGLKKGNIKNMNMFNTDSFIFDNVSKISYRLNNADGTQLSLSPHDNFVSQNEISLPLFMKQKKQNDPGESDIIQQLSRNQVEQLLPQSPIKQNVKCEGNIEKSKREFPFSPIMNTPSFLALSKVRAPLTLNSSDSEYFQKDPDLFALEKLFPPTPKDEDEYSSIISKPINPVIKDLFRTSSKSSFDTSLQQNLQKIHRDQILSIEQAQIELKSIKQQISDQNNLKKTLENENRMLLDINCKLRYSQQRQAPIIPSYHCQYCNQEAPIINSESRIKSRSCDPFQFKSDQLKITKNSIQSTKDSFNQPERNGNFLHNVSENKQSGSHTIQISTLFSPKNQERNLVSYQKLRPSPIKSEVSELGNSACSETNTFQSFLLHPSTKTSSTKHSINLQQKIRGQYSFPFTTTHYQTQSTPKVFQGKKILLTNSNNLMSQGEASKCSQFSGKEPTNHTQIDRQFQNFHHSSECRSMERNDEHLKLTPTLTSMLLKWKNRNSPPKNSSRDRNEGFKSKDFYINHLSSHNPSELDSFVNSNPIQDSNHFQDNLNGQIISSNTNCVLKETYCENQIPLRVTCLSSSSYFNQRKSINNS